MYSSLNNMAEGQSDRIQGIGEDLESLERKVESGKRELVKAAAESVKSQEKPTSAPRKKFYFLSGILCILFLFFIYHIA